MDGDLFELTQALAQGEERQVRHLPACDAWSQDS
jgi:hypothetical protein